MKHGSRPSLMLDKLLTLRI